MPYPIRFRVLNRATQKEMKGKNLSVVLFPSGNIAELKFDFYTFVTELSCKDYDLYIATTKSAKGEWIYKKIGNGSSL